MSCHDTLPDMACPKGFLRTPAESKTRTYQGQVGSERTVGRRGGVGQDWVPTELFAQETSVLGTLNGIEEKSPEQLLGSSNKGIPM